MIDADNFERIKRRVARLADEGKLKRDSDTRPKDGDAKQGSTCE